MTNQPPEQNLPPTIETLKEFVISIVGKPSAAATTETPLNDQLLQRQEAAKIAISEFELKKIESKLAQERVDQKGSEDYYTLRKHWSVYLMVVLALLVIFQVVLTVLIGCGTLAFKDYKAYLQLLIGETFLQIAGMCLIVVRCLFPNKKTEDSKEKDSSTATIDSNKKES